LTALLYKQPILFLKKLYYWNKGKTRGRGGTTAQGTQTLVDNFAVRMEAALFMAVDMLLVFLNFFLNI
jgi:hypothetical protein